MYGEGNINQEKLDGFVNTFNMKLNPKNRWIRMSRLVPWKAFEEKYAKLFKNDGRRAKTAREALGALVVQQLLNLTDRETVEIIQENPYIQYFLGYSEFRLNPTFDASTMVHFRKRISFDMTKEINEMLRKKMEEEHAQRQENKEDSDDDANASQTDNNAHTLETTNETDKPNRGKLLLDATCVPSDIRFPTDLSLLNEAREKTEKMIDIIWEHLKEPHRQKPLTYRKKARNAYLAKAKKRGKKGIRKAVGKQLNYLARNLNHLDKLNQEANEKGIENIYTQSEIEQMAIIRMLYAQQKEMYDNKTHRIPDRIVSLWQSWIRPIVRGKAKAPVEFGAKLEISVVNGFSSIEKISWDNFNESQGLIPAVERYKGKYGHYPEAVLADKLYRNRKNLAYCNERGIRLSGPKLGRPPKDEKKTKAHKKLEYQDSCERNEVEGKFGVAKRKFSLDCLKTKLKETSETNIGLTFFTMNLESYYRSSLNFFVFFWFLAQISNIFNVFRIFSSKKRSFAFSC
jgi:hypothetical protein